MEVKLREILKKIFPSLDVMELSFENFDNHCWLYAIIAAMLLSQEALEIVISMLDDQTVLGIILREFLQIKHDDASFEHGEKNVFIMIAQALMEQYNQAQQDASSRSGRIPVQYVYGDQFPLGDALPEIEKCCLAHRGALIVRDGVCGCIDRETPLRGRLVVTPLVINATGLAGQPFQDTCCECNKEWHGVEYLRFKSKSFVFIDVQPSDIDSMEYVVHGQKGKLIGYITFAGTDDFGHYEFHASSSFDELKVVRFDESKPVIHTLVVVFNAV